MELTDNQKRILKKELEREDLSVYTVVVMALRDANNGDYSAALSRLRVDADKLRMYNTPINQILENSKGIK